MKRIVIIFTSPRINEYDNIWKNQINETLLGEYGNIESDDWIIHVFNGQNRNYCDNIWNFNKIKEKITELANNFSENSEVAIFLHGQEEEGRYLRVALGDDFNWPTIAYTSHTGRFYQKCVEPFIRQCSDTEFNNLWKIVEDEKKDECRRRAEHLRYEVLSPFVAIDLLKQAKKDISTEIEEAVNSINTKGYIVSLCIELNAQELIDDINKLVEKYKELDKKKFHKDLVKISGKLEEKIADIET